MTMQEVIPVIVSIAVIILVFVLQRQSKMIAAYSATMPVNIPLSLWVVYAANKGDRLSVTSFTQGLFVGIIPTVAFVATLWLGSRAGMKLIPMILLSYGVWALGVVSILGVRKLVGL